MTNFNDLPDDILALIHDKKEELETENVEAFAIRFKIVKVYPDHYLLLYKPTQKYMKFWPKEPVEDLTGLMYQFCELFDVVKDDLSVIKCDVSWTEELDEDDMDWTRWVEMRNSMVALKKVIGVDAFRKFKDESGEIGFD